MRSDDSTTAAVKVASAVVARLAGGLAVLGGIGTGRLPQRANRAAWKARRQSPATR
jgi:hypothetical protein